MILDILSKYFIDIIILHEDKLVGRKLKYSFILQIVGIVFCNNIQFW